MMMPPDNDDNEGNAPAPKKAKKRSPIHINPAHKGELHQDLGVPQGQPIPAQKLQAATNSPSPAVRRRAVFAQNAKSFNH